MIVSTGYTSEVSDIDLQSCNRKINKFKYINDKLLYFLISTMAQIILAMNYCEPQHWENVHVFKYHCVACPSMDIIDSESKSIK